MSSFRITRGSLQDRFLASTAKIQFYGGGFANGKTSASCIKALKMAEEYPGSNGLIARATYPKLNDTIRKEFLKWCPKNWIKTFNKGDNYIVLTNGTTINFRYIAQQGKNGESSTSNLLSATYDWIIVDQIEDPEITHKDFLDLIGRLRGMTKRNPRLPYDATRPETGPRWFIITSNPTRNWVYSKLIKPVHDYQRGVKNADLIADDDGKPMIEVFEGSTYENKDNLEADFIKTMEKTYTGQMRERFLMGKWGAFEGLVYPDFDETVHVVPDDHLRDHYYRCLANGVKLNFLQGYDYGIASPSCYGVGFVDNYNNCFVVGGFYKAELTIDKQAQMIRELQHEWQIPERTYLYADPQIFRRTAGTKSMVGQSVADMFLEEGVYMQRGNNDISNGIVKITSLLKSRDFHTHPTLGISPAPRFYMAASLKYGVDEFGAYRWKKDPQGDVSEVPIDKNDHFLDMLKYMFTDIPDPGVVVIPRQKKNIGLFSWAENPDQPTGRKVRYG